MMIDPDIFRSELRVKRVLRKHRFCHLWDVETVQRGDCIALVKLVADVTTLAAPAIKLGVVIEVPAQKLVIAACDTLDQAGRLVQEIRFGMAINLSDPHADTPPRKLPWDAGDNKAGRI
jgi:hypothetical protein